MTKKPTGKKAAPRAAARKTAPAKTKGLAPKVLRFIEEYLVDMNGAAAYKRAGYKATGNSAEVNARRLLRNAQVSAEIALKRANTARRLEISREEALQEAWNIVKADPRDLVEHISRNCRHCRGKAHLFQWRDKAEFERATEQFAQQLAKWERSRSEKKGPPPREPDDAGGYGYQPMRPPVAECPECLGAGLCQTIIKDTRNLSPGALSLYAGVKETKEGIEVKMHSKLDALEKVFKHLGLYALDKKVELTGPNGGPIQTVRVRELSDEELSRRAQGLPA